MSCDFADSDVDFDVDVGVGLIFDLFDGGGDDGCEVLEAEADDDDLFLRFFLGLAIILLLLSLFSMINFPLLLREEDDFFDVITAVSPPRINVHLFKAFDGRDDALTLTLTLTSACTIATARSDNLIQYDLFNIVKTNVENCLLMEQRVLLFYFQRYIQK